MSSDRILSDSAIIGMRNLPDEMRRCGDLPWNFVGELQSDRYRFDWLCDKCAPKFTSFIHPEKGPAKMTDLYIVRLVGYRFITEDMLDVMIYFGQCERCLSVYWGRQGPPFKYLRRYVPEPALG